jgi:CheY-like chemotaxis protein
MSRQNPFILLADDDPNIVDSLAPFLERAGFHVMIVSDGQFAFEKAQSHHPDLIILDVLMPRMDGRETLRRLRQANVWTPTILLTQVGRPPSAPWPSKKARTITSTSHSTRTNCWRVSARCYGAPAPGNVRFPRPGC